MSYQAPGHQQQQVVYQADPQMTHSLKTIRDQLHTICRRHIHQVVRIETMDGHVYVGRIAGCERGLLHLAIPAGGQRDIYGRPFFPNDELVLTLVLYELLVITLLLL